MKQLTAAALAATRLAGYADPGASSQIANHAQAAINADIGRGAR